MKTIIIDAYQYAPNITGSDRMGANFLRELQKIDHENRYYVLCSQEPYIPGIIINDNFTVIKPLKLPAPRIVTRIINKLWRHAISLRLLLLRADTYYSFHNMKLPRRRVAKRMIASNLDLIPLVLDEYKGLGRLSFEQQKQEFERVASSADAFVSISDFSKHELCSALAVPEERVSVIYLAADPRFTTGQPSASTLTLPNAFIFTIGGSEPRKNVAAVVGAFSKLPERLQRTFPLLIAGGEWHGRSLDPLKVNPNVTTLGYVSEDDLLALYEHAAAFVFASTYEGFGFTILEAMACGTPVLSATGSSLDEVAGEAAITFHPSDVTGLRKSLERVLSDEQLRQDMSAKGTSQSAQFSWEKSALQLHALLVKV
jgi:glycosyltransferase involved in cell wall biosynthesis